jgi:hypothetical protein
MKSRLARRQAKRKKIQKAKTLYPDSACPQKFADNLTKCSCDMCGNPRRRWKKKTLQERRTNA